MLHWPARHLRRKNCIKSCCSDHSHQKDQRKAKGKLCLKTRCKLSKASFLRVTTTIEKWSRAALLLTTSFLVVWKCLRVCARLRYTSFIRIWKPSSVEMFPITVSFSSVNLSTARTIVLSAANLHWQKTTMDFIAFLQIEWSSFISSAENVFYGEKVFRKIHFSVLEMKKDQSVQWLSSFCCNLSRLGVHFCRLFTTFGQVSKAVR